MVEVLQYANVKIGTIPTKNKEQKPVMTNYIVSLSVIRLFPLQVLVRSITTTRRSTQWLVNG